jgi:XTP/dITP diphosphohydrolase
MPDETGTTFAANARMKAEAVFAALGANQAVLADDSGLVVDALGGSPGVYSARYAGENASDGENVDKLLGELASVGDRAARFVCNLCLILPDDSAVMIEASGKVEGTITGVPRGEDGFGYDPIFQPLGWHETLAETATGCKDQVSHRGAAARALLDTMRASGRLCHDD